MQKTTGIVLIIFIVAWGFIGVTYWQEDDGNTSDKTIIDDIIDIFTDITYDDTEILFDEYGIHHTNITKVWYEIKVDGVLQAKFLMNHLDYAIQDVETYDNTIDLLNNTSDLYEPWDFTVSYILSEILSRSKAGYAYAEWNGHQYMNITYIETHDAIFNMYISLDNGLLKLFTLNDYFNLHDELDFMTIEAYKFEFVR